MPGSNRTYQEVSTEFIRDHMVQNQVQFRDIVAAQVVTEIRVGDFFNFLHFNLLVIGELSQCLEWAETWTGG
jgi:hypothetical protein